MRRHVASLLVAALLPGLVLGAQPYKPPTDYRATPALISNEAIVVQSGQALLKEAPDLGQAITVTVNGGARTRVTSAPTAGQYQVKAQALPGGATEYLPILVFNAADEGKTGVVTYYGTGSIYTAAWISSLLAATRPSSVATLGALPATSADAADAGGPGALAFVGRAPYASDGTTWRNFWDLLGVAIQTADCTTSPPVDQITFQAWQSGTAGHWACWQIPGGNASALLTAATATGSIASVTATTTGGANVTIVAQYGTGSVASVSAAVSSSVTLLQAAGLGQVAPVVASTGTNGSGTLTVVYATGAVASVSASGGAAQTVAALAGSGAVANVTASGGAGDTAAPVVTGFVAGTPSGLSVPITTFTATDALGPTLYTLTETNVQPSGGANWQAAAYWTTSTGYTFGGPGTYTLYAWAKDDAGAITTTAASATTTVTNLLTLGLPNGDFESALGAQTDGSFATVGNAMHPFIADVGHGTVVRTASSPLVGSNSLDVTANDVGGQSWAGAITRATKAAIDASNGHLRLKVKPLTTIGAVYIAVQVFNGSGVEIQNSTNSAQSVMLYGTNVGSAVNTSVKFTPVVGVTQDIDIDLMAHINAISTWANATEVHFWILATCPGATGGVPAHAVLDNLVAQ